MVKRMFLAAVAAMFTGACVQAASPIDDLKTAYSSIDEGDVKNLASLKQKLDAAKIAVLAIAGNVYRSSLANAVANAVNSFDTHVVTMFEDGGSAAILSSSTSKERADALKTLEVAIAEFKKEVADAGNVLYGQNKIVFAVKDAVTTYLKDLDALQARLDALFSSQPTNATLTANASKEVIEVIEVSAERQRSLVIAAQNDSSQPSMWSRLVSLRNTVCSATVAAGTYVAVNYGPLALQYLMNSASTDSGNMCYDPTVGFVNQQCHILGN